MLGIHGSGALSDFLGDRIVYRRLEPADARLPGLPTIWAELGWPTYSIPRKAEPAYAQAVAHILRLARALDRPGVPLRQLLYIGDTHMNDGTAFANLCCAGDWPGRAFICEERLSEPMQARWDGPMMLANRWACLSDFLHAVQAEGFSCDAGLAVVMDMDKTLVGARGRNDKTIDGARVRAVQATVAGALGERFQVESFRQIYSTLNQQTNHPFTQDNQDLVSYICLVAQSGLMALDEILEGYRSGRLPDFDAFIGLMEDRQDDLRAAGLLSIHSEVLAAWRSGDPTPFKAFRYQEYGMTSSSFDPQPYAGDLAGLLCARILITEEIRQLAGWLRERDVLLFALSDKPDEASVPQPAQAAAGALPLHRCRTLCVGEHLSI